MIDVWPSTWLIQNSLLAFASSATDATISLLFLNYNTNLLLLLFIIRCLCCADRCQRAIVFPFLLCLRDGQRTRTRRLALWRAFSSCTLSTRIGLLHAWWFIAAHIERERESIGTSNTSTCMSDGYGSRWKLVQEQGFFRHRRGYYYPRNRPPPPHHLLLLRLSLLVKRCTYQRRRALGVCSTHSSVDTWYLCHRTSYFGHNIEYILEFILPLFFFHLFDISSSLHFSLDCVA